MGLHCDQFSNRRKNAPSRRGRGRTWGPDVNLRHRTNKDETEHCKENQIVDSGCDVVFGAPPDELFAPQ